MRPAYSPACRTLTWLEIRSCSAELTGSIVQSAAHTAAAAGAVEVSSAGLRKPIGEIYPSMGLLKEFYAAGVPITLGSDAHVAEDVGLQLDAAALGSRRWIHPACPLAAGKYELVPLG